MDNVLELVDEDQLSEGAYETLLATLTDLELSDGRWSQTDSIGRRRAFTRHLLMVRGDRTLETREGFREGTYPGGPWHTSLRYRLDAGQHWQTGFALDQDAGEPWQHSFPWVDNYALYVQYRPSDRVRLIAGNYRVRLGEGLVVNQQFNLGKNFLASTAVSTPNLSPHGSPSEGDRMQGLALEYRAGEHWTFLPFVSVRPIDGTLTHDTLTAWSNEGLHRTATERRHRHASWLTDVGGRAAYANAWMEIGANVLYTGFQYPYVRPVRVYNRNVFRGRELLSGSVDYRVHWLRFWLSGETAVDQGGAWATTGSLRRSLGEEWKAACYWRMLSGRYRQLHGSAMAESSQLQGERGMTLQVQGPIGRRWTLTAQADYWHLVEPQYGINAPSRGAEGTVRLTYERSRWQAYALYRIKLKAKNDELTTQTDDLTQYLRHTFDGVMTWQASPLLTLRTQLRSRLYSAANTGGGTLGLAAAQSVQYVSASRRLKGSAQASWFSADDYETRIFMAEPAVLYGANRPMLYGRGLRYVAVAQYDLLSRGYAHLLVEVKYSMAQYTDHRITIGSGAQGVRGSHLQDLSLQLRMTW